MKKIDYLRNLLAQLTALLPLLTEYAAEQAAEQAAERAKKNSKVQHSPVLFVSAGQLAVHKDPDSTKSPEGGKYIPARKTAAGLFDTPLYVETQPIVFTQAQLRAAFESHMLSLGHTAAKLESASSSEYAQTLVRSYWDIVESVFQGLEVFGYAALSDKPELTESEVVEVAKKAGMIVERYMDGPATSAYDLAPERVSIVSTPIELLEFAKILKG